MNRLLLLIDGSIRDHDKIVAAAKEEVVPLVFNSSSDTYAEILAKIGELGITSFSTIGLAQHGSSSSPVYRITRAESLASLDDMASWDGIIEFFSTLKSTYSVGTIDLISCMIYSNPAWVAMLNRLEERTGLNFRASKDATGNLANGGNWVMESDNVNIEGIYFTEAIRKFKGALLYRSPYVTARQMVSASNKVPVPLISSNNPVNGMIRVMGTGSVTTYGTPEYGGDSSSVSSFLANNIKAIVSTNQAFAAINSIGAVVAWGDPLMGGSIPEVTAALLTSGVTAIASTSGINWDDYTSGGAFAALKSNRSVVTWGNSIYGGDSSSVSSSIASGVVAIASSGYAFAALKSDGSVITWGHVGYGGDSSTVSSSLTEGVVAIASTSSAFAALKNDGSVITWGNGFSSPAGVSSDVVTIATSESVFAALKADGSVITWGGPGGGSDYTYTPTNSADHVVAISSNKGAFAALRADGSVITWGSSYYGGTGSSINDYGMEISVTSQLTSGVTKITSSDGAFVALKDDNSLVAWGWSVYGGNIGYSELEKNTSNIISVAAVTDAFIVIRKNGELTTWGTKYEWTLPTSAPLLTSDVVTVATSFSDAIAIKQDRSAIPFGIDTPLYSGVEAIATNNSAFAVITTSTPGISASALIPTYGSLLTLSVTAPKANATYQWYRNSEVIADATSSTLTFDKALAGEADGIFHVRETVSRITAESNNVLVQIQGGPSITGPPGETTFVGARLILSTPSLGPTSTYAWTKNGVSIDGITGPSYIIESTTEQDAGSYGLTIVYKGKSFICAPLSINIIEPSTPVITSTGESIANGAGFTLSVIPPVAESGYTWYKNNVPIPDVTSYRYIVTNATNAAHTGIYKVIYSLNGVEYTSDDVTVTVATPTIGVDIETPAFGEAFSVTLVDANLGATYQWYRNGSPIDGKTATSLSYTSASALQNDGAYFVRQTVAGVSDDSNTVSITVGDPPAFEIRNDAGTYDADTQTYMLSVDYNAPFTIYAYSSTPELLNVPFMWFKDSVLIEAAVSSTYTVSKAIISSNNGIYTAIAQIDGKEITCINSVQVTVRPPIFMPTVDMTVPMISARNPVNRMVRVMAQGAVESWGEVEFVYDPSILQDVVAVTSNQKAFAAIKSNGSVITWGDAAFGGDSSGVVGLLESGVVYIATTYGLLSSETESTYGAFAALKSDGSVVTWGHGPYGGNSSEVAASIESNVVAIAASATAFAALKTDGSVVTWGDAGVGGDNPILANSVIALASTNRSFAALYADGSVYSWGVETHSIPYGVVSVATTMDGAFTAIMDNGAIAAWGNVDSGASAPEISGGVVAVSSTKRAFAALTESGRVIAWGDSAYGGVAPTITVAVSAVVANHGAFAALLADRTVVAWGDVSSGGVVPPGLSDVVYLTASDGPSFSAITTGGRVISWGAIGLTHPYVVDDVSANVVQVVATANSVAAVKRDGSLVTWGASNKTLTNVIGLVASRYNFAAIRGAQTITATTTTPDWQSEFTLSVISANPSATYQWYRNDRTIDDATGSSYAVNNAFNLQDGGIYYVRETVNGVTSVSNSLLVTVGAPSAPVITPRTERFEEGYDFTLGLVFGLPLVIYRWYREGVLLLTSTTSDASLNVVKPLIGQNDGAYTVVMTADGREVASAPYNVTLKVGQPVIKRRQEDVIVAGNQFELYLWVVSAGASYVWFKDGVAITDASGTSYTVAQSNYFSDAGTYKVQMTFNGETLYSNEIVITIVIPAPVITATTETPAYKSGFTLSVTSSLPSATYQWYLADRAIDGATDTTYVVSSATKVAHDGVYFIRQTLTGYNTDSNTKTITVGPPPAPIIGADVTEPMATTSFTLSVTNPIEGAIYTWYKDTVEIIGAAGVTYTGANVSVAESEGSYTVRQYVDERTASSAPIYIRITEPTDPIISATTTTPTYGGAFTLSVATTLLGSRYQWFKNNIAINGATNAVYTVPNATATAYNGSYRVEQYLDIYTNSSSALTITVGAPAAPILFAWNSTPDYKGYLHLALESETTLYGVGSATYKWYKNGVELPGETGANYYKDPVDALTYDGIYTIQRTLDGKTSTSNEITVIVGAPAAPTLSVTNATPDFYTGLTFNIASPYIGYGPVFSWYKDGSLLEGVASTEYSVAKANGNLHNGSYTVRMGLDGKIINGAASVDITVVGDPETPVISATTTSPPFNAPFTITIENPIEGITYDLYRKYNNNITLVRHITKEAPSLVIENAVTSIHTGEYFAVLAYVGRNISSNPVSITISTGPSVILTASNTNPIFGTNITITMTPAVQFYSLYRKLNQDYYRILGGVGYIANAVTPSRSTGEFYILTTIDGVDIKSNSIFLSVTLPPMPSLTVLNGLTQVGIGRPLKFSWATRIDELNTQAQDNAAAAGEYPMTGMTGMYPLLVDSFEYRIVKDNSNYGYMYVFNNDMTEINSVMYQTSTIDSVTREYVGAWCIEYAVASGVGVPPNPLAPPIIARTNTINISVVSMPVISQQPVGGTMYHNGIQLVSSLELSVGVSDPGSYQWYRGTTPIPGATSATYNVKGISLGRHQFYVKVTNAAGSVNSSRVTVTVKLPEISSGGGDTTRIPATITPAKEDVSCNLTLGLKQPNPTYDISYVMVTLRQDPYPSVIFTDPSTGYPPADGVVTKFQQTITKTVGSSDLSFSATRDIEGPYVYGQVATNEFYHNCAYTATVESFFKDGTTTVSMTDGIRNGNTEYVSVLQATKPVAEIQNISTRGAPEFSVRIKQQLVQEVRGEWDDGSIVHVRVSLAIPGSSAEPKIFDIPAPYTVDASGGARIIRGRTIIVGAPHIDFSTTYDVRAHVLYRDLTYVSSDVYTIGPYINPPNPYEFDTLVSDTYNFIINDYLTATAIPGTERALDSSDSLVLASNTEAIYYDSAAKQYRDDGAVASAPVEFVTPYYYKRTFENVTSADSLYYRKQSMIQFFRSIGDIDITGISDENVSYDMLLDKILAIINADTSTTGDSSYAIRGFTLARAFRKLGVTNPLDTSKVYDLYYADTVGAQTIGFEYNSKGFLYRWYLWMAVDAAKAGVVSSDTGAVHAALKIFVNKIIFSRKYVDGENIIASFNNSINSAGVPTGVKTTLQQVDRTIYSQQFRNSDTRTFHRIVRLYRKWDTNHFDNQMERIDSNAFNGEAITEICMLSQYSSDVSTFKTTSAGNIAIDPVHFPHIRDCFVHPKNPDVIYNEKLFLIGHALLHGAPIYRSRKRKILNTAGNHVLNLDWDTIYDLSGEALYRCYDVTQDNSGRYLIPRAFKNMKTLRLTYYDPVSQTFKPSFKPVVFQPGKLTVLEYNVDTNAFTSPQGSTYPIGPEFAVTASTTVYTTEGEIIYTPLSRGVVFDTSLNTWNYKPQSVESECNRVYDAQGAHCLTISGDELYAVGSQTTMRINYYTGNVTNLSGDLVYMYNYDLGEFTAVNGGAKFVTRVPLYNMWYVSYIPPWYFANTAILEATVSWRYVTEESYTDGSPPSQALRDAVYIGVQAFPVGSRLRVPTPYLDNAVTYIRPVPLPFDYFVPGGTAQEIFDLAYGFKYNFSNTEVIGYVFEGENFIIDEPEWPKTFRSTVATVPSYFFTRVDANYAPRTNMTYVNTRADHQLLRVPVNSIPAGCVMLRDYNKYTVLPGSASNPARSGTEIATYTGITKELVIFSGIVYVDYYVKRMAWVPVPEGGSVYKLVDFVADELTPANFLWVVDAAHRNVRMPPIKISTPPHWAIQLGDMTIENLPFYADVDMAYYLDRKIYYSGLTYKKASPSDTIVAYDRVPPPTDADRLTGTVYILHTPYEDGEQIKNFPSNIFGVYEGIDRFVLPTLLLVYNESLVDKQRYDCGGATWRHERALGYPILEDLSTNDLVCLPYVQFYDDMFNENQNIFSVRNGRRDQNPPKFVGKRAFYLATKLHNFNFPVHTVDDEGFAYTMDLCTNLVIRNGIRIGVNALVGSSIKDILIEDTSGAIIDLAAFNGFHHDIMTVRNSTLNIVEYAFRGGFGEGPRTLVLDNSPELIIGRNAFANNSKLRTIMSANNGCKEFGPYSFAGTYLRSVVFNTIGDVIIGEGAFQDTSALGDITITSKIKSVGPAAFKNSRMENLTIIDASGLIIHTDTFRNTSRLNNVTIRNSTLDICENAFSTAATQYLRLESSPNLVIGSTVFAGAPNIISVAATNNGCKEFGDSSFKSTPLRIIEFSASPEMTIGASAFEDTILLNDLIFRGNVKKLGTRAFYGSGIKTLLFEDVSGLNIPKDTFSNTPNLDLVTIRRSLMDISENAFFTRIKQLVMDNSPNMVIGERAFFGVPNLYRVTATNDGCKEMGPYSFANTPLRILELNRSADMTIGDSAFENTPQLESLTITGNIKSLGSRAFNSSGVQTITITDSSGLTIYGDTFNPAPRLDRLTLINTRIDISANAFSNTTLRLLELDHRGSLTIGDSAFENTPLLEGVTINGNYVKYLGARAFKNSGLKNITFVDISGGVTTIDSDLFKPAPRLNSLSVLNSNLDISAYAFADTSLTTLTVVNSNSDIGAYAFADTSLNMLDLGWNFTWVPLSANFFELTDAVKARAYPDDYYMYYTYYLKYKKTFINIGPSAFEGTTQLGDVGLYWNIKSVDHRAFYGSGITNLTINDTSGLVIYNDTFANTPRLNTVTITNSSITMEDMTFVSSGIRNFIAANTPELVIPFKAFFEAPNLESALMGNNGSKEIGAYAFANTSLRTLTLNSVGNYTIGEGAFENTPHLDSIHIYQGLKALGTRAFYNSGLKTITFTNSSGLTVYSNTFNPGPRLNSLTITNSNLDIRAHAFAYTPINSLTIKNSNVDISAYAFAYTPLNILDIDSTPVPNYSVFPLYYFKVYELSGSEMEPVRDTTDEEKKGVSIYMYKLEQFYKSDRSTAEWLKFNNLSDFPYMAIIFADIVSELTIWYNKYITIGASAFEGTTQLGDVELSWNIKSIGPRAFYGSGITNLTLHSMSVIVVQAGSFANTRNLNTITIRKSTLTIQPYAFGVSDISAADISSAGVRTLILNNSPNLVIGERAFSGAQNLTTVTSNVNGCNYFGPYSFANCKQLSSIQFGTTTITLLVSPERVYYSSWNDTWIVTHPAVYENYSTSKELVISEGTFENTPSLQEIIVYSQVKELGAKAFKGSGIRKFDIISDIGPSPAERERDLEIIRNNISTFIIKEETFMNTPNLGVLHMKYGLRAIEDRAFKNSGVTKVELNNCPDINIGEEAFANTARLIDVLLFGGKVIKKRAFYNSNISSIFFSSGVQYLSYQAPGSVLDSDFGIIIEEEAFRDTPNLRCPFEKVQSSLYGFDFGNQPLPHSFVKSFGDRSFYNSGITEIFFSNERVVTVVNGYGEIFYDSSREARRMVVDAVTIGTEAFYNSGLKLFRIDASSNIVLGHNMFGKCANLESIRISGIMNDFDTLGSDMTGLKYLDLTFDLSANTALPRLNAPNLETVVLRGGFRSMHPDLFNGCTKLKTAKIYIQAGDITDLPPNMFKDCTSLISAEVYITGGKATGLPTNMFKDCTSLETVIIDSRIDTITSFPSYMFSGCNNLKTVTLYANATTVPFLLFDSAANTLETVHITLASPNDSTIGPQFRDFISLKDLTVICPTGRVTIHPQIFSGCISLVNINIDAIIMNSLDNRDSWGGWAFKDCRSLKGITLIFEPTGSYTTNIPFSGLTSLETLLIRGTVDVKNTIGASSGDMTLYGGGPILSDSNNLKHLEINGTLNGVIRQSYFPIIEVFHINYGRNTVIRNFCFMELLTLRKVVLTGTLTDIGVGAFFGCTNLASLTLGEGLVRIEDMAFGLTGISGDVVIPYTVRYLGDAYFAGCNNITGVRYDCTVIDFSNPFIYTADLWYVLRDTPGSVLVKIRDGDVTEFESDISSSIETLNIRKFDISNNSFTDMSLTTNRFQYFNEKAYIYRRDAYDNMLSDMRNMYLEYTGETSKGLIKLDPSGNYKDDSGNTITLDAYKAAAADEMNGMISTILIYGKDSLTTYDKQDINFSTIDSDYGVSFMSKLQSHWTKYSILPYTTSVGNGVGDAAGRVEHYNNGILNATLLQPAGENIMKIAYGKPISLPSDFDIILNNSQIYSLMYDDENNTYMNMDAAGIVYSTIAAKDDEDMVEPNVITFVDGSELTTNGSISMNITYLISAPYAKAIYRVATEVDPDSFTSVNFEFYGAITSIEELSNIQSSDITIYSVAIVIKDSAMNALENCTLNIPQVVSMKIHDYALARLLNTRINIQSANTIICGINVFTGSENIIVNSNKPLTNIPIVVVYNSNSTHLLRDIPAIIATATDDYDIDLSDVRDVRIETVVNKPEQDTPFKAIPVIKFRTVSNLLDVSIVLPPDDWFWCYRLDPERETSAQGYFDDFKANNEDRRFKYIPNDTTKEEFVGLENSFAPRSFEYMGVIFRRRHSLSDYQTNNDNVTLWAVYSALEAAKDDKTEIFRLILQILIEELLTWIITAILGAIITFFTAGAGAGITLLIFKGLRFLFKFIIKKINLIPGKPGRISFIVKQVGRISEMTTRWSRTGKALRITSGKADDVAHYAQRSGSAIAKNGSQSVVNHGKRSAIVNKTISKGPQRANVTAKGVQKTAQDFRHLPDRQGLEGLNIPKAARKIEPPPATADAYGTAKLNKVGKPNSQRHLEVTDARRAAAQQNDVPMSVKERAARLNNSTPKPPQELNGLQQRDADIIRSGRPLTDTGYTTKTITGTATDTVKNRSVIIDSRNSGDDTIQFDINSIDTMYTSFGDTINDFFSAVNDQSDAADIVPYYRRKKSVMAELVPSMLGSISMTSWIPNLLGRAGMVFSMFNDSPSEAINRVGKEVPELITDLQNGADVNIHEYATYRAMTATRPLFAIDLEGQKMKMSESITTGIERASLVDDPTYLDPSKYTEIIYDTEHKAYRIHYYLTAITNRQPHTFFKDVRGSGNGVSSIANPLHVYDNNLWNGLYLGAPSTPANAAVGGGIFDFTPRMMINSRNDEFYLGTRNVDYDFSANELPNVVYAGVSNLSIMLPPDVTEIPIYSYCGTDGGDGNLPLYMNTISVPFSTTSLSIGYRAFYRSSLTAFNFPPSLRSIAEEAFSNSNLTNVKFITKVSEIPVLKNVSITLTPTSSLSNSSRGTIFTDISILTFTDYSGALVTYTDVPYFEIATIGSLTITNVPDIYFSRTEVYTGNMTIRYSAIDATNPYTLRTGRDGRGGYVLSISNISSNSEISGVTQRWWSETDFTDDDGWWIPYNEQKFDPPRTFFTYGAITKVGATSQLIFNGITTNAYIGDVAPPAASRSRGVGVTIGANAFANNKIETLTLPPYIDSIGENAFSNNPISMIRLTGSLPLLEQINLTFFQQLPQNTTITVPQAYIQTAMDLFAQAKLLVPSLNVFIRLDVANVPIFPAATSEHCFVCYNPAILYSSKTIQAILGGRPIPDEGKFVNWLTLGITSPGMCFRGLGRATRVYRVVRRSPRERARQMLQYIFQQIQYIGGAMSEGITGSPTDIDPYCTGWVCTYSADGKYPIF